VEMISASQLAAENNKYCSKLGGILEKFGCVKTCHFIGFYLRGEHTLVLVTDLTDAEKRKLDLFFGPHGYTVYKAFCAKHGL